MITPARLQIHEDALVGFDAKLTSVTGSFDTGSRYIPSPAGDTELDLEQDLFGAVRFLRRGQAALLVPAVETRRATPQLGAQGGGGVGDVNASARWDFVLARESWIVPGIAVLAGVTAPSGKAPDAATPPLFSDATGIGAWQLQAALALEQTWGPWLANLTAIAAKRTEHGGETLGTQYTLLAAGAYIVPERDGRRAVGLLRDRGERDVLLGGQRALRRRVDHRAGQRQERHDRVALGALSAERRVAPPGRSQHDADAPWLRRQPARVGRAHGRGGAVVVVRTALPLAAALALVACAPVEPRVASLPGPRAAGAGGPRGARALAARGREAHGARLLRPRVPLPRDPRSAPARARDGLRPARGVASWSTPR